MATPNPFQTPINPYAQQTGAGSTAAADIGLVRAGVNPASSPAGSYYSTYQQQNTPDQMLAQLNQSGLGPMMESQEWADRAAEFAQLEPQRRENAMERQYLPRYYDQNLRRLGLTGQEQGIARQGLGNDNALAMQLFGLQDRTANELANEATTRINEGADRNLYWLGIEESGRNTFVSGQHDVRRGDINQARGREISETESERARRLAETGARRGHQEKDFDLANARLDVEAARLGIDREKLQTEFQQQLDRLGISDYQLSLQGLSGEARRAAMNAGWMQWAMNQAVQGAIAAAQGAPAGAPPGSSATATGGGGANPNAFIGRAVEQRPWIAPAATALSPAVAATRASEWIRGNRANVASALSPAVAATRASQWMARQLGLAR